MTRKLPYLKRAAYLFGLGAALLASQMALAVNTDKIDYNRYDLDGPVADMMWCGAKNEVILVLTELGTVYRSRDRGGSWKRLQQVMSQVGGQVADQDQEVGFCFHVLFLTHYLFTFIGMPND
jgi:hypothetical protein